MTETAIDETMQSLGCSRQQAVARLWIRDRIEGKPQPAIPRELACPDCGTLTIPCPSGHDL